MIAISAIVLIMKAIVAVLSVLIFSCVSAQITQEKITDVESFSNGQVVVSEKNVNKVSNTDRVNENVAFIQNKKANYANVINSDVGDSLKKKEFRVVMNQANLGQITQPLITTNSNSQMGTSYSKVASSQITAPASTFVNQQQNNKFYISEINHSDRKYENSGLYEIGGAGGSQQSVGTGSQKVTISNFAAPLQTSFETHRRVETIGFSRPQVYKYSKSYNFNGARGSEESFGTGAAKVIVLGSPFQPSFETHRKQTRVENLRLNYPHIYGYGGSYLNGVAGAHQPTGAGYSRVSFILGGAPVLSSFENRYGLSKLQSSALNNSLRKYGSSGSYKFSGVGESQQGFGTGFSKLTASSLGAPSHSSFETHRKETRVQTYGLNYPHIYGYGGSYNFNGAGGSQYATGAGYSKVTFSMGTTPTLSTSQIGSIFKKEDLEKKLNFSRKNIYAIN